MVNIFIKIKPIKFSLTKQAGAGLAGGDGGDSRNAWNPVFQTDLFNPLADTGKKWTTLSSASIPRLYHSGAILIADGRVVTLGSEMQK